MHDEHDGDDHDHDQDAATGGLDVDRLLLIVTGAHLRSEIGDRPLAYGLRERINNWADDRARSTGDPTPFDVVVCSDVWYLNNDELRACPTISVGGPGVNALSAFLADKLPSAFVVENVLMVQLDLDFEDVVAAVWGMDHGSTVAAVDAFTDRYLEQFLEAAARQIETG